MRIENIDADTGLAVDVSLLGIPAFILEVIRPLERKYYDFFSRKIIVKPYHLKKKPIRMFVEEGYENIAHLIHTIPIYLCDSKPKSPKENDIVDPLGAYFPNTSGDSPYIELYPTEIEIAAKGNDQHFKWLFTKVLLHELAHAALDIHNNVLYKNAPEKVHYWTTFGKWREESMANAVALRIIKEYGDEDFYEYAKQFMLSQPPEYALGVLMEDFDDQYFWSVTTGKKVGANQDLQNEWLDYVKGTPDWEGLKQWNVIFTNVVYSFNGKSYLIEEFIIRIVEKVLSDYEAKTGEKMSYSIFESIFPYFNIYSSHESKSYEIASKVQNDPDYKKIIHLLDTDIALYTKSWYCRAVDTFVDNCGIKYVEIQMNKSELKESRKPLPNW